jgi:murein DD-endopeptidase MepM/ murein hydrolase activator NlpD
MGLVGAIGLGAGASLAAQGQEVDRAPGATSAAAQQMEATILRQLLSASGAFKPSGVAGGQLRADMFIETLADAVAKGGGIGIARMLDDALGTGDGAGAAAGADPLAQHAAPRPAPLARAPGATGQVTSGFGQRADPLDGTTKYHTGIDLRAPEGSPIRVGAEGTVRRAGPRGGYGNAVEIDHGAGLTTLYAHASQLLVKPGEKVTAGQEIARVGQTGRATGPHLHFEVRKDDRPVDPTRYGGMMNRALNAYQRRAEATGEEPE